MQARGRFARPARSTSSPRPKVGLERAFDRWLTKHPEIPPPQRNIKLGFWEIDCYWPEHDLALELDGRPYHTVIEDIERDHRKDIWLQANRKRILRVTDSRFKRDKTGVHRDLTVLPSALSDLIGALVALSDLTAMLLALSDRSAQARSLRPAA